MVEDYSKDAPEGLKIVYHEANIVWSWIRTEQAFYDGATQGMAISGVLAFLMVLAGSKGNIIIAILAIKTVALIVMCIVAIFVM